MSASLSIYKGDKFEISVGKSTHGSFGWLDLIVTETDGATHEITVHFDTKDGYAAAVKLARIQQAMNADQMEVE